MFKITPIQSPEAQIARAKECGITARDGFFAYEMFDVDTLELMGMSQFEISADGGYISELVPKIGYDDFEAMFILGRQTMNFIDICGSSHCRASLDAAEESLIKAIGFKHSDNYYECCTEGMFDGSHCSGGHK